MIKTTTLTVTELKLIKTKNTLLRYKLIKELYNKIKKEQPHVPLTKILEVYICPVYPISRTTLYSILCTSITNKLKMIEELEKKLVCKDENI